jgi:hypothetical protein
LDIKALYEIKRHNFLQGFIANPKNYDPALAYAYEHRLAPVHNEEITREQLGCDPFEDAYVVKADFMNQILEHIDDLWNKEDWENLQFNKLEDTFGGYKKHRMEIARIIQYARIKGLFDDQLYDAISEMAPIEAKRYYTKFTPSDIVFS